MSRLTGRMLVPLWLLIAVAVFSIGQIAVAAPQESVDPPPASEQGQAESEPPTKQDTAEEPTQDIPTPPVPFDTVDRDSLNARAELLAAVESPTDEQKQELALLREAQTALSRADEAAQRRADYLKRIAAAPEALDNTQKTLEEEVKAPSIPRVDTNLEALISAQDAARTRRDAALLEKESVAAELATRATRRDEIPAKISDATLNLERIRKDLSASPSGDEPPEITSARRMNLTAQREWLTTRLAMLDTEQKMGEAIGDLLLARQRLAERTFRAAERELGEVTDVVNAKRALEARDLQLQAEAESKNAKQAHPLLQTIAEQNAAWAEQRTKITESMGTLDQRRGELDREITRLKTRFDEMQSQINRLGLSEDVGKLLRNERSQLPDLRELERRLRDHRDALNKAYLRSLDLSSRLTALIEIDREAQRRISDSAVTVPPGEREDLLAKVEEALAVQEATYLRPLYHLNDDYQGKTLGPLIEKELTLTKLVREYLALIDEHILWVQSTAPINTADGRRAVDAAKWLLNPTNWRELVAGLWADSLANIVQTSAVILLWAVLLFMHPRIKRRIIDLGSRRSKATRLSFKPTMEALGLTALLGTAVPLGLWYVAWRLLRMTPTTIFAESVSDGIGRIAIFLFNAACLWYMCMRNGLGEAHFRWRHENLKLVRTQIRWLVPIALPCLFVFAVMQRQTVDTYHDSLGRFAFIALMIVTSIFAARLLHPRRGALRSYLAQHHDTWLDRLRNIWFPTIISAPIVLAIAAGLGYFYTAFQFERRILFTAWLVIGCVIVHAMVQRWLLVTERRIAVEQARRKLAAQAKAQAEEQAKECAKDEGKETRTITPAPVAIAAVPGEGVVSEVDIDIQSVSAQSRRLLASMTSFAVVIGLVLIWANVLPALNFLQSVQLWTQTSTVMVGDAATTVINEITLGNLFMAIIVLLLTVAISRNIPGLLEMTVLQRLPLTSGGRYATTTLVRYILVIIGMVVAFDTIGIGWSTVQWLVAAMTVGLGFGLQEIFANFVSGLIILFEQPIRIGDTVTVSEIHGTVTRIKIRATTITDWDNKELVIPNKEFVTGQIINWTLTDPVTRVRIQVGIAYGSDTELAKRMLLDVARRCPIVLDDPTPQALFLGFGDNSLNFEARVFIRSIDDFVPVRDAMHMGIDKAFRNAHIEISFPQRDLHVRSIDSSLLSQIATTRTANDPAAEPVDL